MKCTSTTLFACCYLIIGLLGCAGTTTKAGIPDWTLRTGGDDGSEEERFFSFSTPRTSHAPGYIYRTSKSSPGDVYVTTLGDTTLIEKTSESLTQTIAERTIEVEYLASLLGVARLGGSKSERIKVKLVFEGCSREMLTEKSITTQILSSNINFRPDEKYYVIQATILATKVLVEFESYKSLDVGVQAQLDSLSASGGIEKTSFEKTTIEKVFDVAHRICYKPLQIDASGLLSSGGQTLILTETDDGFIGQ